MPQFIPDTLSQPSWCIVAWKWPALSCCGTWLCTTVEFKEVKTYIIICDADRSSCAVRQLHSAVPWFCLRSEEPAVPVFPPALSAFAASQPYIQSSLYSHHATYVVWLFVNINCQHEAGLVLGCVTTHRVYHSSLTTQPTYHRQMWLGWHSGNRSHELTLSPVRIGTVDDLWQVYRPIIFRPFRPTQPGHPFVGRCKNYWRWLLQLLGKKWQVLHSSVP